MKAEKIPLLKSKIPLLFYGFPCPRSIFITFQIKRKKLRTFHDFPGCVGTTFLIHTLTIPIHSFPLLSSIKILYIMEHNIATWAAILDWLVKSKLICCWVIIASFVIDQSMNGQICTKAAWTARGIHNESPADTDSLILK